MANSQIGSVSLIGATLAGALAFLLIPAGFLWIASLIGLILLLVLLAYEGSEKRSAFQIIAFSAVCGLCLMLASLAVYQLLLKGIAPALPQLMQTWLPLTYIGATIVMLLVNFARNSAYAGTPTLSGALYSPATVPTTYTPSVTPVVAEMPPSAFAPMVAPEPPAPSYPEPVEPHLVRNGEPIRPTPEAVPVKPGKETSIYVNLMGEGLNMLRAVRAEHLGRDYYRITEPMPESEQWEYAPGQVVRCRKKNLSSGKALVAVEEAPRAQ